MILRDMPDGHLLCINQTSHALMAEEFCRHWGNHEFARPEPYSAVMLGIAQHDNGWYEWEQCPQLRDDGRPMDFLHGPPGEEKLALWQRGVDRAGAQHPYAGLLVARHAARLYQDSFHFLPTTEQASVSGFIRGQEGLADTVRSLWGTDAQYGPALEEEALAANTHLLKFGDSASLRALLSRGAPRPIDHCPVDGKNAYVDIAMTITDSVITFDPWPFGVATFAVSIHGRLLEQTLFPDAATYQAALANAPLLRLTWQVRRAP